MIGLDNKGIEDLWEISGIWVNRHRKGGSSGRKRRARDMKEEGKSARHGENVKESLRGVGRKS